jgi:integrase
VGYVEDRWYHTIKHPDGRRERVKSARYGKGKRYRVRYRGPDGREHNESFPDRAKRQADDFLVSVESDKLRGSYVDPAAGRTLFGEYAETWLRTRDFDESTRETTEYRVRKHLLPLFGGCQLAAIKPKHIREWDSTMAGTLARSTRSVVFVHLSAILSAAVDDGKIGKNPCLASSVTKPRPVERKVVPWNPHQVTAIRSGLAGRYQSIVDVAAGCGMRQGEVFGLAVDDVDFESERIHIVRQVKLVRSRLVYGLPKNDRDRWIPLPGSVGRVLAAHIKEFPPVLVTLPWENPASTERVTARLVFTTTRRGALNRSYFDQKVWRPAVTSAGITPGRETGMHALRHFYASALLDAGESIKALAEYLGHTDPGFTLRVYTHLMPASEDRTRKAIDNLFGAGEPTQTAQRRPRRGIR